MAAMPRKQGYNWRARQSDKPRTKKHLTLNNVVEGAVLSVEQGDTNYLALPSKREAESSASQTTTKQKRPRLGKKQKKRLKKVVQAKEKTAKVCVAIAAGLLLRFVVQQGYAVDHAH